MNKGMAPVIKTVLSYKVFRWNTVWARLLATDKMFLPEHKVSINLNKTNEQVQPTYSSTWCTQVQENPSIKVQTKADNQNPHPGIIFQLRFR